MPINIENWKEETEASVKVAISKVKAVLEKVEPEKITIENANDLYKVSNSLASLSKSIESIERSARDRNSLLRQAADEIRSTIRAALAGRPELVSQFYEVIDESQRMLQLEQ